MLLISVAPLAATLLVKVVLYRCRRAEGENGLVAAEADRIDSTAAEREGVAHLRRDAVNERGVRRSIANKEEGNPAMKNRNIIMTAADHAELGHATPSPASRPDTCSCLMEGFKDELARAEIVAPEEIPADAITMNSRAELLALDTGERRVFTLVFPSDANLKDRTVSVLAPLGTAMLGRREGDEFKWSRPAGCGGSKWSMFTTSPRPLSESGAGLQQWGHGTTA